MNDFQEKAKQMVYELAKQVERWREEREGTPVIIMSATMIATIALGAPGVIDVEDERAVMLGCYVDVSASGEHVYLAREVEL